MTDDDKTPVDPKCGAPIRARDGSVLNYVCNLSKGHLGKHAEVDEPHDPWSLPAGPK